MAEHQHIIAGRIDHDGKRRDHRGENRAAQRRHENAQHIAENHWDHCPLQDMQEIPGAGGNARVLPGCQHQRLAQTAYRHRGDTAKRAQPQRHADRAPHLAHGMAAAAQFGGNQRRHCPGHPG